VSLESRGASVPARAGRCLLVWASGTTVLGAVAQVTRPVASPALLGSLAELPLDRALVDLAALILLGCLAWGWLALTVTVVEALRGAGTGIPRIGIPLRLPHGVRRLVLGACGVALVSGLAQPALAAGGPARTHHERGLTALVGLPLPDRAVVPASASPRAVVVRPGDSLWSIAARDLRPDALATDVASRWHAIYAANRGVIGPDPDLLEPGQRLLLPRKDPS
jgi:hypothetical protein